MKLKRIVGAFFGTGVVGVLAGATAYACTNLATLNISSATGNPGDVVTLTGSSFAVPKASDTNQTPTPVVLHWNGVDGPELARTAPDGAGNISTTFTVPQSSPGYYVIVASQRDEKGDKYGTPARASFQILGPGGQAAIQQPATQLPATLAAEPSSSGMVALTIGLGILGLALFAAGFTAFARQARRRDVPATAPVRRD
ncbi:MAG: hypothetical protein M3Q48_02170 [Actinomycetota bacterium]|nr:hypothetical protein [Actinomycetota bacterium]